MQSFSFSEVIAIAALALASNSVVAASEIDIAASASGASGARQFAELSVRHAARSHMHGAHGASFLRKRSDDLGLKSAVALVMDQDTSQILFSKNHEAVLPIASLTKLMTALVTVEAGLPLDETLEISSDDTLLEWHNHSQLRVGTRLSRSDLMHLALMSSENRAAHALGRNYPGGIEAFVAAMNEKAHQLGMSDTRYVEPTGLSSDNRSSARDLATLARAAYEYPLLREFSTSSSHDVSVGRRLVRYRNTNALVNNPTWEIGLQKTGYIAAAGRCLMMQAKLAGRKLIMVFLDSNGKYTRLGDAQRVRRWIESQPAMIRTVAPAEMPSATQSTMPAVLESVSPISPEFPASASMPSSVDRGGKTPDAGTSKPNTDSVPPAVPPMS